MHARTLAARHADTLAALAARDFTPAPAGSHLGGSCYVALRANLAPAPVIIGACHNGPRPVAAGPYTGPAWVRCLPMGMRGASLPEPLAPADAAALTADLEAEAAEARAEAVARTRRSEALMLAEIAAEAEQLDAAYDRHYDRTHTGE